MSASEITALFIGFGVLFATVMLPDLMESNYRTKYQMKNKYKELYELDSKRYRKDPV